MSATLMARAHTLPVAESPCWPIAAFELQGEHAEAFQWALASAIRRDDPPRVSDAQGQGGRCLGAQGLDMVRARVEKAIAERGYTGTRVIAPPPLALHTGVFTMTVVPGVVRTVQLTPDSAPHAPLAHTLTARPGQLLHADDIAQSRENLRRLPSVQADLQVVPVVTQPEPEEAQGSETRPPTSVSDLRVRWIQGRPWRVRLNLENSGSRAVGRWQGNAQLTWDNPLGYNDQLTFSGTRDMGHALPGPRGNRSQWVSHGLPWGAWQWSTQATVSDYHVSVVNARGTRVYSGQSQELELKLRKVLFRDATGRISGQGRLWARDNDSFVDGVEQAKDRRRTRGWEAGWVIDQSWGGRLFDATFTLRQGVGGLGAMPAPEERSGEGTARMRLVSLESHWTQPFRLGAQKMEYTVHLRGQRNQTRLTPQDRFYIGDRASVRGFTGDASLGAERGWVVRNDLGWRWHALSQTYLGVDHGQVSGPSAAKLVGTQLTGMAWGLRGEVKGAGTWNYDLFLGRPLTQPVKFPEKEVSGGVQLTWVY